MTLARYPYERAIPLAGQRETPEARKSQHPLNQDNMEFIKFHSQGTAQMLIVA